jgi:chromate reductase, NAD(P)H dehydrogenase (quinone)
MSQDNLRVLGIAGSLRRHSYNRGLLRVAQEVAPEGMSIEEYDIAPIPLFNQDLEADLPAAVVDFKERIAAADALLIATPEYNYSIPGVLKNAIDWASRPITDTPLRHKPIALMGTGGLYGTVRSQLALRQVFLYTESYVLLKPEVILPNARDRFDAEGNLLDESVKERVHALLEALTAWTVRFK